MKWAVVLLVVVMIIGAVAFPIMVKNGLIGRSESVKEGWSQIDAQLMRRADLIPNLVNTVKGYAAHENEIFTKVAEARASLLSARGPEAKAEASAQHDGWLGRLLAVAENYPQHKASDNFVRLQDELAGTENRIAVARTRYNTIVKDYNATLLKFPGSLFAGGMGLLRAEYYQPPESKHVQAAPEVKF